MGLIHVPSRLPAGLGRVGLGRLYGYTGYGAFGAAGEHIPMPPEGYTPPTQSSFVSSLTGALKGIDGDWAREHLSVPVASTVPLLKTAIATAGNLDFDALAAAASGERLSKTQVGAIIGVVTGLVQGALEIASQLATGTAAVAIADAAEALPALGGAVTAVLTEIVGNIIVGATAEASAEEQARHVEEVLAQKLATMCQNLVSLHTPFGTGAGNVITPADYFRRVAYAYKAWLATDRSQPVHALPLDGASMYVMLCGGESQGFGMSRDTYQKVFAQARAESPKIGSGIPTEVRRQMWKLIVAICETVTDPISNAVVGDQGLAPMPILQDLAREYYTPLRIEAGKKNTAGWDRNLAKHLSDLVTNKYQAGYHENVEGGPGSAGGAGVISRQGSCAGQGAGYPDRHVDLSEALVGSVTSYQARLREQFQNPDGTWTIRPSHPVVNPHKTGVLTLSPQGTARAADGILEAIGAKIESRRWLKLVLSAAAAGGAYYLGRRYRITL